MSLGTSASAADHTGTFTQHLMLLEGQHRIAPSGVYTMRGPYGHRTFSIDRQDENDTFAPGQRLLSILGSDPDTKAARWFGIGFVKDPKGSVETAPGWQYSSAGLHEQSCGKRGAWCPLHTFFKPYSKQMGTDNARMSDILQTAIIQGKRHFNCAVDSQVHEYEILLAKRCLRCGIMLTTPKSLAAGYGPECRKKLMEMAR